MTKITHIKKRYCLTRKPPYRSKHCQGFTLIELIISLAIAGIIGVTLTLFLNQSYTAQQRLESLTELYSRATLLFTQLERDLMGATIPIENILALAQEQKKKGTPPKTAPENKTTSEAEQPISEQHNAKKTEEVPYKAFEKVFYCIQKKPSFIFSWISRDPLQLYWGSSIGEARPRIARIMYRLEPDPHDKTVSRLLRSEGFDLNYTLYEKHTDQKYRGSVLIDGIKNIAITLVSIQEKKDEKAGQSKDAPSQKSDAPPVFETKRVDTWEWPIPTKEGQKKDDTTPEDAPPLPNGIHIKLTLWNAATEKEVVFESAIAIPSVPNIKPKSGTESSEKKNADPTPQSPTKDDKNPRPVSDNETSKDSLTTITLNGIYQPSFNPINDNHYTHSYSFLTSKTAGKKL